MVYTHAHGSSSLRETALFLSFPYVCPEPVLVKRLLLYINEWPFSYLIGGSEDLHNHIPATNKHPDRHEHKNAFALVVFVFCL